MLYWVFWRIWFHNWMFNGVSIIFNLVISSEIVITLFEFFLIRHGLVQAAFSKDSHAIRARFLVNLCCSMDVHLHDSIASSFDLKFINYYGRDKYY